MDDDTIGLRQPDAASLYDWVRPAAAAFGEEFSRQEFDHDLMKLEQDRLIGGVDGDAWVGTGGSYFFFLRATIVVASSYWQIVNEMTALRMSASG